MPPTSGAERVEQGLHVVAGRAEPTAGPHRAGDGATLAASHGGAGLRHALGADAEQADEVGVRAEASVAHADAELGAEARRHERVVHAGDGEGRDGEPVRSPGPASARGPSTWTPSMARNPSWSRAESAASWARIGVPADPLQLVHGGAEGHRPDHVGRPRLLSFGGLGPDHLVEVDQVDRAAAGQERVAGLECASAAR